MARALVIVDVQNDFAPGGALAVPRGDEVLAPLNAHLASGAFDVVVATRDWHPPDHGSFRDRGGPWPVHCVAGTPGAQLVDGLAVQHVDRIVDKGTDPGTEGYSGFDGTDLADWLKARDVDELVVAGLATDYCVRATALEALQAGFDVTVDAAASRGIDAGTGDVDHALQEIRDAGGRVTGA